ncbi:MAG TPA: EAL domain-containing protein, partial [Devosiaceae bacterium]|nr:EAL domain-containing protein [Devosiaceae bacterium]
VALREALGNGELSVVYQPQVDLETGRVVGAEALLRWQHPQMGAVSPELFIPVAEDCGLIMEIGCWVLLTACRDAANWPRQAQLAVNVSALQFEYGDVLTDIDAALAASNLAPAHLEIEVTESAFMGRPEAYVGTLALIRERGVRVTLDDFGTGYSSLGYLTRIPADSIKIDRMFVRQLPEDQESMAIIRSVLTLADSLRKTVVAEGIETADQAWVLRLAGCQLGQGFHFGRPQTQREFCELLALDGPAFRLRSIA